MSELMSGYVGGIRITPEQDTEGRVTRITIDVQDAGTDNSEFHRFITDDGCLAGLLSAVLAPDSPPNHTDEFTSVLNGLATARDLARDRIPHMAVIARDRSAWSWRRIASALGTSHRTVERQVTATRREMAENGVWVDAAGVHDGTTPHSRHLTHADRLTIARALAHHRETIGNRWEHPVEISVPDRLVPGQVATATARHRTHPARTDRLVLAAPVTLSGGPADGLTVDTPTGAVHVHVTVDNMEIRYVPGPDGAWVPWAPTN